MSHRRPNHAALRCLVIADAAQFVGRGRALSADESRYLETIVRRLSHGRESWRWSEQEDRTLIMFIKQRARVGRPKPYQPNNEVRQLAADMGRTYMAVHRRIERLRKRMKCSNENGQRKG